MKYLQPSFSVGGASSDFDSGFERTFGERKVTRGRFVYRRNPDTGELESVPVGGDVQPARLEISTDRRYENTCATDGTDISSRRKREAYMQANGLADPSDFKDTWAKAAKEREAYRKGETVNPSYREAVGRAEYELSKRKKRR